MPSTPPAPGLFSTITCEPSDSVSRCAMKRAMKSEPPPGANGTMMRTGLDGILLREGRQRGKQAEKQRGEHSHGTSWGMRILIPGRIWAIMRPRKSNAPMIKIENLVKIFGAKRAVDGISFTVERGEVLGFLGPNGAGKSTTMRMITGFYAPTGGKVSVGGHDMVESPLEAKRLIGYLPENAAAYSDMTVHGFLGFAAEMRGLVGEAKKQGGRARRRACFLASVLHQSIDTLSKGYRHRTCLAQALIHDPEVLILDEPTDGLDPNQKHEVRNLIRELGKTKAIIFSTHILEEVDAACTRAIIIDRGRIVANGTPDELGRPLDEVFRRITSPGHGEDMRCANEKHLGHRQARARQLLHLAGGLRVPGHLPAADRLLHLHRRPVLRARRGEPGRVLRLASLALPGAGAGGRHAPVGRGAPRRHDRAAADDADHALAGDRRQVPRLLGLPRASRWRSPSRW